MSAEAARATEVAPSAWTVEEGSRAGARVGATEAGGVEGGAGAATGVGEQGLHRRGGGRTSGVLFAGAGKKVGEGKRKKDVEEIRCLRVDDEGESLDFDSAVQKITRGKLRFHSRVTDEHFLFLKIKCSIKPHEEMLINKFLVWSL